MHVAEIIRLALETTLYAGQAGIYAMAFQAARHGHHTPSQTYLASSLIHLSLAARPFLPLG